MKIVIASDSFKGSASSLQVAQYLETGIRRVLSEKECTVVKVPIADGGEGTLEVFKSLQNIQTHKVTVLNPLSKEIISEVGYLGDNTYLIEMASSSGLTLIKESEYNPYETTSYGLGQLIKKCLDLNAKKIIIGIGGSATNDCGIGMLQALGMKFYDLHHKEVDIIGSSVFNINDFDIDTLDKRLKEVEVTILSDVSNPLLGPNGASAIFGPQKGLSPEDVIKFDNAHQRFSNLVNEKMNKHKSDTPGAGAAGGVGYALLTFFNSKIKIGVNEILSLINFNDIIKNSNLIITGEGRLDSQSIGGKAITGVTSFSKEKNIPLIVITGSTPDNLTPFYDLGINLIVDIINRPMSLEGAMSNTKALIENAGENIIRAYLL